MIPVFDSIHTQEGWLRAQNFAAMTSCFSCDRPKKLPKQPIPLRSRILSSFRQTKRFAKMIASNLAKQSTTKFAAVRLGDVLGSGGVVVQLFKKQIAEGGPVTVSDLERTRYFMTILEASRLVIQAGTLAREGEVFALDI